MNLYVVEIGDKLCGLWIICIVFGQVTNYKRDAAEISNDHMIDKNHLSLI